jgi:hypothetical protein
MRTWSIVPAVLCAALLAGSCGAPCRDIQARPLEFECSDDPLGFLGELHFDSASSFETFLRQQCLDDPGDADAILEQVDFGSEGVFVATGRDNLDAQRCLRSRELESAQVCTTGLKLYFRDELQSPELVCAETRWTVAFALPREDLRAAIEAGRTSDFEVGL